LGLFRILRGAGIPLGPGFEGKTGSGAPKGLFRGPEDPLPRGFYINPSRRGPAPGAPTPAGNPGPGESPIGDEGRIPAPSGGSPPESLGDARLYPVKRCHSYVSEENMNKKDSELDPTI